MRRLFIEESTVRTVTWQAHGLSYILHGSHDQVGLYSMHHFLHVASPNGAHVAECAAPP